MRTLVLAFLLAACGHDSHAMPDASPATVGAALAQQQGWSDDIAWRSDNWTPCSGCEHLITYSITVDAFDVHVWERTPGQAATEKCHLIQHYVENPVPGFDPKQRTVFSFMFTASEDTCGFGSGSGDYVTEVVARDATGLPTYFAQWTKPTDPASPFPGYDYVGKGVLASAMRLCTTAPGQTCEPACDLTTQVGCTLPPP